MTITPRTVLTKIRSAGDFYAIVIENDLEGQTLTGAPTTRLLSWASGEDRSSHFPDMAPAYAEVSVAGAMRRCIRFWLGAAVGTAQAPGLYAIEAIFETDEGRKPAGVDARGNLPQLIVSDV